MTAEYIYLIIFCCIAYLIVTDNSVAQAVYLITKIVKNKFEIMKWWIVHNPSTPWAKYSMHRRSVKLAKEIMKVLHDKND